MRAMLGQEPGSTLRVPELPDEVLAQQPHPHRRTGALDLTGEQRAGGQ